MIVKSNRTARTLEKLIMKALAPGRDDPIFLTGQRSYIASFSTGVFECHGTIKLDVRRLAEKIKLDLDLMDIGEKV